MPKDKLLLKLLDGGEEVVGDFKILCTMYVHWKSLQITKDPGGLPYFCSMKATNFMMANMFIWFVYLLNN